MPSCSSVVDASKGPTKQRCPTRGATRSKTPRSGPRVRAAPHGALVDDSPCLYDEQCAGGLCRSLRGSLEPGLLVYPECGRCARGPAVGDACEYGKGQCEASSVSLRASGLTCSPTTGKCVPRSADESCATAGTCDGLGCFEGLGCNPLMVGPMKPGKTSLVLGPSGSAARRLRGARARAPIRASTQGPARPPSARARSARTTRAAGTSAAASRPERACGASPDDRSAISWREAHARPECRDRQSSSSSSC